MRRCEVFRRSIAGDSVSAKTKRAIFTGSAFFYVVLIPFFNEILL